jgi:hypothetical protein
MQRPHVPIAYVHFDGVPLPEVPGIDSCAVSTSTLPTRSPQLVCVELLYIRRRLLIPPRRVIASSFVTRNASGVAGPQAVGGSGFHSALFSSEKETTRHG